jgi:nucleoside-diphosphate-sugar epimerase
MIIVLVGGSSSLAAALTPVFSAYAEVITAGRTGCDIQLDLAGLSEAIHFPADVDAVINAAADFGGKDMDSLLRAQDINVMGALKLGVASVRAKVKHFVQVSSVFALLDPGSQFFNAYAMSKRQADEALQLFCTSFSMPLAIVRPSQFYGTGTAARKHQPFLLSIIDKAQNGEDISFYGNNDAKRNFIHVADVAKAISSVVRQKVVGTYCCQSLSDIRYSEIAAAAVAAFGTRSNIAFASDKPDIPDNILPIDDALYRMIGHGPKISFQEGMVMEALARRDAP